MTSSDITRLRLINQGIASKTTVTPLEVVRRMGAIQAQDYYGSLWSIGLRTAVTEKELLQVVTSPQIIRTWPQRGTLHFVPADDARWLVGLSAERVLKGATRRRQEMGITEAALVRSREIIVKALKRDGMVRRPRLMEILEAEGISTSAGRGYHILWYLSQTGVTFIGPMADKQQTIGLLDTISSYNTLDHQAGVAELARRYFTSHGPATVKDFVWWSGLTVKDVRQGIEANADVLTSQTTGGVEYWLPKTQSDLQPERIYLLPGFDEYMLGYADRSAGLPAKYSQQVAPGGNGMFLSTVVIDGQVVGTWKRTIKKDHVALTVTLFASISLLGKKALQPAADKYGHFLGLPAKLTIA